MKSYFKSVLLVLASLGMFSLMSCDDKNEEESIINEQESTLIDECLLVRGDQGELLDLHIMRDEDNQVSISTNPSDIKSTDEYIPTCIIIADDIIVSDHLITLPETDKNYWTFEVTLGDLNDFKAPPGGSDINLECNCMAQSGSCSVFYEQPAQNIMVMRCLSKMDSPCSQSGVTQDCVLTLPTVTIQIKSETSEETTKLIIESDMIEYNGLIYE